MGNVVQLKSGKWVRKGSSDDDKSRASETSKSSSSSKKSPSKKSSNRGSSNTVQLASGKWVVKGSSDDDNSRITDISNKPIKSSPKKASFSSFVEQPQSRESFTDTNYVTTQEGVKTEKETREPSFNQFVSNEQSSSVSRASSRDSSKTRSAIPFASFAEKKQSRPDNLVQTKRDVVQPLNDRNLSIPVMYSNKEPIRKTSSFDDPAKAFFKNYNPQDATVSIKPGASEYSGSFKLGTTKTKDETQYKENRANVLNTLKNYNPQDVTVNIGPGPSGFNEYGTRTKEQAEYLLEQEGDKIAAVKSKITTYVANPPENIYERIEKENEIINMLPETGVPQEYTQLLNRPTISGKSDIYGLQPSVINFEKERQNTRELLGKESGVPMDRSYGYTDVYDYVPEISENKNNLFSLKSAPEDDINLKPTFKEKYLRSNDYTPKLTTTDVKEKTMETIRIGKPRIEKTNFAEENINLFLNKGDNVADASTVLFPKTKEISDKRQSDSVFTRVGAASEALFLDRSEMDQEQAITSDALSNVEKAFYNENLKQITPFIKEGAQLDKDIEVFTNRRDALYNVIDKPLEDVNLLDIEINALIDKYKVDEKIEEIPNPDYVPNTLFSGKTSQLKTISVATPLVSEEGYEVIKKLQDKKEKIINDTNLLSNLTLYNNNEQKIKVQIDKANDFNTRLKETQNDYNIKKYKLDLLKSKFESASINSDPFEAFYRNIDDYQKDTGYIGYSGSQIVKTLGSIGKLGVNAVSVIPKTAQTLIGDIKDNGIIKNIKNHAPLGPSSIYDLGKRTFTGEDKDAAKYSRKEDMMDFDYLKGVGVLASTGFAMIPGSAVGTAGVLGKVSRGLYTGIGKGYAYGESASLAGRTGIRAVTSGVQLFTDAPNTVKSFGFKNPGKFEEYNKLGQNALMASLDGTPLGGTRKFIGSYVPVLGTLAVSGSEEFKAVIINKAISDGYSQEEAESIANQIYAERQATGFVTEPLAILGANIIPEYMGRKAFAKIGSISQPFRQSALATFEPGVVEGASAYTIQRRGNYEDVTAEGLAGSGFAGGVMAGTISGLINKGESGTMTFRKLKDLTAKSSAVAKSRRVGKGIEIGGFIADLTEKPADWLTGKMFKSVRDINVPFSTGPFAKKASTRIRNPGSTTYNLMSQGSTAQPASTSQLQSVSYVEVPTVDELRNTTLNNLNTNVKTRAVSDISVYPFSQTQVNPVSQIQVNPVSLVSSKSQIDPITNNIVDINSNIKSEAIVEPIEIVNTNTNVQSNVGTFSNFVPGMMPMLGRSGYGGGFSGGVGVSSWVTKNKIKDYAKQFFNKVGGNPARPRVQNIPNNVQYNNVQQQMSQQQIVQQPMRDNFARNKRVDIGYHNACNSVDRMFGKNIASGKHFTKTYGKQIKNNKDSNPMKNIKRMFK